MEVILWERDKNMDDFGVKQYGMVMDMLLFIPNKGGG